MFGSNTPELGRRVVNQYERKNLVGVCQKEERGARMNDSMYPGRALDIVEPVAVVEGADALHMVLSPRLHRVHFEEVLGTAYLSE